MLQPKYVNWLTCCSVSSFIIIFALKWAVPKKPNTFVLPQARQRYLVCNRKFSDHSKCDIWEADRVSSIGRACCLYANITRFEPLSEDTDFPEVFVAFVGLFGKKSSASRRPLPLPSKYFHIPPNTQRPCRLIWDPNRVVKSTVQINTKSIGLMATASCTYLH